MNDAAIEDLARRAGIAVDWTDYDSKPHRVSIEVLRQVLSALGLPCATFGDLAQSKERLGGGSEPMLLTATAGLPIVYPSAAKRPGMAARLIFESGESSKVKAELTPAGLTIPAVAEPGYHSIEDGDRKIQVAVAPKRCWTIDDVAPGGRMWGIAAQLYGLRSPRDFGIGDMSGAMALAGEAASYSADALALSPIHALFGARSRNFSPYSPSNRRFYNPLHADPRTVFGHDRVAKVAAKAGLLAEAAELEKLFQVDWSRAVLHKMLLLRGLFDHFAATDLAAGAATPLAADFLSFQKVWGEPLENHARFEALHDYQLKRDPAAWDWQTWPKPFQDARNAVLKDFARENSREILFHSFLQWLAERSLAAVQRKCRDLGMRIGLIADLAVGISAAGSEAWTNKDDVLIGLHIGAPPDLYNARGQDWGLTTFSPQALIRRGFAPFIDTLRACLKHAGGLRIDHAMGLLRLWVIPRGADPAQGAYIAYPIDDLLRLIALESFRHRAIVIGEDLGTVPEGFRERLETTGIYGMRLLWFERNRGRYVSSRSWPVATAAMTSTHDLPTVAGWWRGKDIATRAKLGMVPDAEKEEIARETDRQKLWQSFRRSKAASGPMPAATCAPPVVDAAVKFVAETGSQLALVPLDDILGIEDQPNLPGTIDEHPNWRRRYPGNAGKLLADAQISRRLAPLRSRGEA